MKPVAIFRHSVTEGAGYFATFLDSRQIPWRLIKADQGNAIPAAASLFSGIGFMGGPMSVNDDLPWIAPELALIRDAVRCDIPVIGHCLGGQLMSKALGGAVTRNPVKEIGWGRVDVLPGEVGKRWLGEAASFESFHWHGKTFSVPPGSIPIDSSVYCQQQMFVSGKHVGMQCHVEMTPELISVWCADWEKEIQTVAQLTPSVQTPAQMLAAVEDKTAQLRRVADRIYKQWIKGLLP